MSDGRKGSTNKWVDVNGKHYDAKCIAQWFFQVDDPRQSECESLVNEAIREAALRAETPDVRPGIVAAINYCLGWYLNRNEPGFLNVALELQIRLKDGAKVFEEAYARAALRKV